MELETSNLVNILTLASASPGWRTIPERGVVRSREPFKCLWAATISLERLMLEFKRYQILYTGRLCQVPAYTSR